MNREILFRGKRLDNNEWAEGHFYTQVYYPETIEEDWYGFIKPFGSRSWEYVQVNHNTVGQYTGLKDKNGKRIFEGDIVEDSSVCGLRGKVVFGEGTFDSGIYRYNGWYVEDADGDRDHCALVEYEDSWNKFEVIGNIHDNPELIGGAHGQI